MLGLLYFYYHHFHHHSRICLHTLAPSQWDVVSPAVLLDLKNNIHNINQNNANVYTLDIFIQKMHNHDPRPTTRCTAFPALHGPYLRKQFYDIPFFQFQIEITNGPWMDSSSDVSLFQTPTSFSQPQSAAFCFFFLYFFLWKTLSEIHCPEKLTFTVLWYLHITVIFAFSMERRFPSVFKKKQQK